MSGLYHEASHDLFRLNPQDGPTPRDLFERFVAWPLPPATGHPTPAGLSRPGWGRSGRAGSLGVGGGVGPK
ncbi:hypothetical protein OG271_11725 [Micromonospora rifamycinica]|uniref:hypothetical protein n=1 Tax=Micromonospora rifamycinica TaxID=291594 RepID=UPI002E287FC2|nr:hypothetical protein [Micromonospora rifamycinica]